MKRSGALLRSNPTRDSRVRAGRISAGPAITRWRGSFFSPSILFVLPFLRKPDLQYRKPPSIHPLILRKSHIMRQWRANAGGERATKLVRSTGLLDDLLPPQSEETRKLPGSGIESLHLPHRHRFCERVKAKSFLCEHVQVLLEGPVDVGGSNLGAAL